MSTSPVPAPMPFSVSVALPDELSEMSLLTVSIEWLLIASVAR